MRQKWIVLILVFLAAITAAAQEGESIRGPWLLCDRSWALSGDSVWFVVAGAPALPGSGNVVHVRLEDHRGDVAGHVMVVTAEGSGMGYLVVPDSLSSGVYRMRAYTGNRAGGPGVAPVARLLTVYHRFAEEIPALPGAPGLEFLAPAEAGDGGITVDSDLFSPGDRVSFTVTLPERLRTSEMTISASLGEAPAALKAPYLIDPPRPDTGFRMLPPEENGFFVEGRVLPAEGIPLPQRSMVLLSIPGEDPWFDYCFTDPDGYFRFRLKNAFGRGEIFLRALGDQGQELNVELASHRKRGVAPSSDSLLISEEQERFVKEMIEGGGYERLFSGTEQHSGSRLQMEMPGLYPFYGPPEQRIFPAQFADLPDFVEISRELLPAVRFRGRGTGYSLRIIDNQEKGWFEKNPLRLINGIPVFDNNLIYRLKSTDIRYIDIVYRERIFGDISFKGVLAIMLEKEAETRFLDQEALFKFPLDCLQLPVIPPSSRTGGPTTAGNLPDFRRVFLFRKVETKEPLHFSFTLSDLKGPVLIKLEGIDSNGLPFEMTRKIMVQ